MVVMKVLWTKFAMNSLNEIFIYYKENVSIIVAQNIKENIISGSRQLANQPLSESIEPLLIELKEEHRYLIRGNYKIISKIKHKKIYITDIFDTRQDPDKLNRKNESNLMLNEPNEKLQLIS